MTSGPDDRSTLTIKFGKGYEDPWFVASGNPASIRRQLLEFAGLEDDPDETLQQLGIEVASDRRTYEEGYVDGSADGTRVDFELGYDKGFEEGRDAGVNKVRSMVAALCAAAEVKLA